MYSCLWMLGIPATIRTSQDNLGHWSLLSCLSLVLWLSPSGVSHVMSQGRLHFAVRVEVILVFYVLHSVMGARCNHSAMPVNSCAIFFSKSQCNY